MGVSQTATADGPQERRRTTETMSQGAAANDEVSQGQFVTLVSSDEHEFTVSRECATVAGTIRNMLSGPGQFEEQGRNEIAFREISSHVLERICIYLYYKNRYAQQNKEIPVFKLDPTSVLNVLMAANFLDV